MKKRNRMILGLMAVISIVILMLALGACSSKQSTPTTTPTTTPSTGATTPATTTPVTTAPSTTTSGGLQSVTMDIVAQNLVFTTAQISVPAGAGITINFRNSDSGIVHNIAVYEKLASGQTKPIFVGDPVTGPVMVAYHFVAPASGGSYFFQCDFHPTTMKGTFLVTP